MNAAAMVRVRDVSDIVTKGTTPTSLGRRFTSSGVRFLKVETFAADGSFIAGREAFIDDSTHQLLRRSQLAQGDILFSIAGALGRSTVVEQAWLPANTNQAFAIIRPSRRRRSVHPRYLLWQLRSPAIARRIADISVQAAQANLSLEQVRDFEIPFVSSHEQEAIATALDDVDDLIATLERLMAKKQAIKQGMMQQLLTGRTRLPGFNAAWRSRPLGELLSYEQPSRYLVSSADYTNTGTPVLTAGKTFVLGHTTERHGIFEDLPVIIFDDFTTASKYVDFPFKAKSSAMKMLSARAGGNLRYIFERMQLIDFVAVDHKRRWIAEFSKIEINLPGKDEQDAVVVVLEDFDAEIDLLRHRLVQARATKTGMMQQLLTGRVRLPVEASA